VHWWSTATLAEHPYLVPDPGSRARRLGDRPDRGGDDLRDDVRRCRSIVEGRGMQLMVCDQSRPDIGLPVVKVIVPGLRHFWSRFAPGRLYDVPVSLGQPALKADPAGTDPAGTEHVTLPRPDLREVARRDEAFAPVLDRRVSVREHGQTPLTVAQLGEFPSRCARVRTDFDHPVTGTRGTGRRRCASAFALTPAVAPATNWSCTSASIGAGAWRRACITTTPWDTAWHASAPGMSWSRACCATRA
jgi:hypothetical protein